jgi:ribosomal protein S27AE
VRYEVNVRKVRRVCPECGAGIVRLTATQAACSDGHWTERRAYSVSALKATVREVIGDNAYNSYFSDGHLLLPSVHQAAIRFAFLYPHRVSVEDMYVLRAFGPTLEYGVYRKLPY